jgi:hypothetical protein
MELDLHLAKLALLADLWAGFDLLSYSAGLLTAAPVLLLAALLARLTDRPRREPEPEPASGRVQLLDITGPLPDLPEHPGTRGKRDAYTWTRIPPRPAYDPYLEADDESNPSPEPEWDRYPGPIGS